MNEPTVPTRPSLSPYSASARHQEAYLSLLHDITKILGIDWAEVPSENIKTRINESISNSLRMWI